MANCRRSLRRDWDGFYRDLIAEMECQDTAEERLVVGENLPEGVFAVERVVTARKQKRRTVSRAGSQLYKLLPSIFALRSTWYCGKATVERKQAG